MADISKLEQQLVDLRTEVSDQRKTLSEFEDAMEAMFEHLEKVMTTDEVTSLLDEKTNELSIELDGRTAEHRQTTGEIQDAQSELKQEISQVEVRLEATLSELVNDSAAQINARHEAHTKQMDGTIAQLEADLKESKSIAQTFGDEVEKVRHDFLGKVQQTEVKFDKAAGDLESQFKGDSGELRKLVDGSIRDISAELRANKKQTDDRLQELDETVTQNLRRIDGKLDQCVEQEKLSEEVRRLEDKCAGDLKQMREDNEKKLKDLEELDNYHSTRCEALDAQVERNASDLAKFDAQTSDEMKKLHKLVGDYEAQAQEGQQKVELRVHFFTEEYKQLVQGINADKEGFRASIGSVEDTLRVEVARLDYEIESKCNGFNEKLVETEGRLAPVQNENHRLIVEHCEKFNQFKKHTDAELKEVKDGHQINDKEIRRLLKECGEETKALSESARDKLDREREERSQGLKGSETRITKECDKLREEIKNATILQKDRLDSLEKSVQEGRVKSSSEFDIVRALVTQAERELGQKLADTTARVDRSDGTIERLTETVQLHHTAHETQGTAWAVQLKDTRQKVDEHAEMHRNLQKRVGAHDAADYKRQLSDMQRQLKEECDTQHGNLSQLQEDLRTNVEDFSGKFAQIQAEMESNSTAVLEHRTVLEKDTLRGLKLFEDRCIKLEEDVSTTKGHFTQVYEHLDERIIEDFSKYDTRLENQNDYFSKLLSNCEQRMKESSIKQQACTEEVRQEFDGKYENLARQVTTISGAQETRMTALDERIKTSEGQFTIKCDNMEKSLIAKDTAQDARMASMSDAQQRAFNKFSDICNELERHLTVQIEKQGGRFGAVAKELSEKCEALGRELQSTTEPLNEQIHKTNATAEGLVRQLRELDTSMKDEIARRSDRQSHAADELKQALKVQIEQLEKTCVVLETEAKKQNEQQVAARAELSRHVDETKLEFTNHAQQLKELPDKWDALRVALEAQDEKLTSWQGVLNEKVTNSNDEQSKRIEFLRAQFDTNCSNVAQRMEDHSGMLDKKICSMQEALDEQHLYFVDLCDKVNQRCVTENAAQDERADDQYSRLIKQCDSLDARIVESVDSLQSALEDQNEKLLREHEHFTAVCCAMESKCNDAVDNVSSKAVENRKQFLSESGQLRDDLTMILKDATTRADVLEESVRACREQFDKLYASTDDKFSDLERTQCEEIKTQQQHFIEACHDIDQKFTRFHVAQTERMDALSTDMQKDQATAGTLHKKLDDTCTEQLLAQKQLIDKHYNDFSEQHASLKQQVQDNTRQQESLVEQLSSSKRELERLLQDECSTMNKNVTRMNGEQDERVGRYHEYFTSSIADLNVKVDDENERQNKRTDDLATSSLNHVDRLQEECNALKAQVIANNQSQNERMDSMQQHFEDANEDQDRKFGERMNSYHQHMTSASRAVDQKLSERAAKQDERTTQLSEAARENHRNFTNVCGNIERHFTSICADIVNKFTEEITVRDELIKSQHNHFENACTTLDAKLAEAFDSQQKRGEELREHFTHLFSGLDSKLQQADQEIEDTIVSNREHLTLLCGELETRISETTSVHQARMDDLDQRIVNDRQHFADVCATLEQNVSEHHQHFTGVCEALDEKFTENSAAYDDRLQNHKEYFSDVCSNLEQKMTDSSTAQNARTENQRLQLIDLCDNLDRKVIEKSGTQDRRMDELADLIQKNRQHFTSVCSSMEQALKAKDTAQDDRMATLSDAIKSDNRHFTEICTSMNDKFMDENAALSERIKDHFKHFTNENGKIDHKLSEKNSAQDELIDAHYQHFTQVCLDANERFSSTLASHAVRHDETSKTLESHHAHFTEMCAQLDEKFTADNEAQSARAGQMHEHSTGVCTGLEAKVDEQHAAVMTKHDELVKMLQDYRDSSAAACASVDEKYTVITSGITDTLGRFGETNASQDTRMDGLGNVVEQQRLQFESVCKELDKKITADHLLLSKSLKRESARLTGICESLDQKYDQKGQSYESRLDSQGSQIMRHHADFTELYGKLNVDMAAKNAQQEQSLQLHHQHFTGLCVSLEQKLAEKNSLQDGRLIELSDSIQKQQDHFSKLFTELDNRLASESASQESRAEKHRKVFAESCSLLDAKLIEQEKDHNLQIDKIRELVTTNVHSFANRCSGLEEMIDLERNAKDLRIKTLESNSVKQVDNVRQLLDDVRSAHEEKLVSLSTAMAEHREHWITVTAEAKQRQTEQDSARDETADTQYRELKQLSEHLDAVFKERACAQEARTEEVNCLVQEHHQHFSNAMSNLDSKFTLKTSAQDERSENHREFYTTQITNLNRKFAEKSTAQDTRADELSATVQEHFVHFTASCDELDRKFTEANVLQDDHINTDRDHFSDLCGTLQRELVESLEEKRLRIDELASKINANHDESANMSAHLDSKFTDAHALSEEKINTHYQYFVDLCANLDRKTTEKAMAQDERSDELASTIHDHRTHFTDVVDAMDQKFVEINASQDECAQANHSAVLDRCAEISNRIAENDITKEARMDEFSNSIAEHHLHFSNLCKDLDAKFDDKHSVQDERVDADKQHVKEIITSLDEKLTQMVDSQTQRLTERCAEVDAKVVALNNTKDSRMDELSSVVIDHHRQFTDLCGALDKKLMHSQKMQDERTTEHYKHFGGVCEEIKEQLTNETALQATRTRDLEGKVADHHKHFTSLFTQMNEKFTKEDLELKASLQSKHNHLTEVCETIDAKFTAKTVSQASAQDMLARTTSEVRDHFTSVCIEMDAKFSEANLAQDERTAVALNELKEAQDSLGSNCTKAITAQDERVESLRGHFTDVSAQIDDKFVRLTDVQTARIDELLDTMNQRHERTTAISADLDEKFTGITGQLTQETSTLGAAIEVQRQDYTGMCGSLDEKFTEQNVQMGSRVEQDRAVAAAAVDSVSKHFADEVQRIQQDAELQSATGASRFARLEARFLEQQEQATQITGRIEQTLTDELTAQAGLLGEHSKQLSAACANMDRKLSAETATREERLEACHAHFSSVCSNLDSKFTDEVSAIRDVVSAASLRSEAKFQDVMTQHESNIESEHRHFDAVCSDITRRFTEHDAELDEKLVAMCGKLEKQFTGVRDVHATRSQQHYEHFTAACTSLEERLCEKIETAEQRTIAKQAEQELRSEGVAKVLSEQRTFFTESCDRLDNALSDRLDSLTSSVDDTRHSSGAACADLERKLRELIDTREEAHAELHSHFTDRCDRLRSSISERTAEVDTKCMDACGRLDRRHTATVGQQSDAMAGLAQRVENLQQHIGQIVEDKYAELERQLLAKDGAVSSRVQELSETVSTNHGLVTATLDRLKSDVSAETAQLGEQISGNQDIVTGLCQSIDEKFAGQMVTVHDKIDSKNVAHDERLTALADKLCSDMNAVKNMCRDAEDKLLAKNNEQDTVIDEQEGHFLDTCAQLDRKLTAQVDTVHEAVRTAIAQCTEQCTNLETSQADKATLLRSTLADACTRLDGQLSQKLAVVDARIDREHQHFSDIFAIHERNSSEQITELRDNLKKELTDIEEVFTSTCAGHEAQITENYTHFSELYRKLDTEIVETNESLLQKVHDNDSAQRAQLAELGETVRGVREEVREELAELTQRSADKDAAQDVLINSHFKQLSDLGRVSEQNLLQKIAQQDQRLQEQLRDLRHLCENTDTKFTKLNVEIDTKYVDAHRALDRDLRALCTAQAEDLNMHVDRLTEVCGKLDQKFTDVSAEVDERFTDNLSKHQSQLDVLATTISDHHAHFTDVMGELDQKFREKNAAQDEALQENVANLSSVCNRLDSRFTQDLAVLEQRVSEKNAAQDERLDEISETIEEHHQQFTLAHGSIERQSVQDIGRLDDSIGECREESAKACGHLRMQIVDLAAEFKQKLTADVDGLRGTCDTVRQDAKSSLDSLDAKFSQACERLQAQAAEHQASNSSHFDTEHAFFEKSCAEITQLMQTTAEGFEIQLRALREDAERQVGDLQESVEALAFLPEAVRSIEGDVGDNDVKNDRQVAELSENFFSRCSGLESSLSDAVSKLSGEIDEVSSAQSDGLQDLRTTVQQQHSQLVGKMHDEANAVAAKNDAQDSVIGDHYKYFVSLTTKIEAQCKERLGGLEDRLEEERAEFVNTTTALDRKIVDSVAGVDERLSGSQSRLEQRVTERSLIVDDKIESVTKHAGDICARMHEKLTAELSAIDDKFTKLSAVVSTQYEEQANALQASRAGSDEALVGLGRSVDEKLQQLRDEQAIRHDQSAGLISGLDVKISEQWAALDGKILETADAQNRRYTQLETAAADTQDKFAEECEAIKKRFEQADAATDELLQKHVKRLTAALEDLQCSVTDENAVQNELIELHHQHFSGLYGTLNRNLTEEISELDSKQSQAIEKIDKRLADNTAQLDDKIQKDHASLAESIALLEQTHIQQLADMDAGFSQKSTAQDGRLRELTEDLHSHRVLVTDVCSALDKKFADQIAAQDAVIVTDRDHFTKVCQQLGEQIEQEVQGLTQTIADNEASHTARSDTISAEMSHQTQQLAVRNDTLGKTLDAATEALRTELTQSDQRLSATCAALDSRISDVSSAHATKMMELESHFTDALEHITELSKDELDGVAQSLAEASLKMNQKFDDKNSEQDKAFEDALKEFKSECARLDHELHQASAELSNSQAAGFAQAEKTIGEIGAALAGKLNDQHDHFTAAYTRLDNWVQNEGAQIVASVSDLGLALDRKLTDEVAKQEEKLAAVKQHFSGLAVELDRTAKEATTALDIKFAKAMETLDQKFGEKTHATDAFAQAQATLLEEHVNNLTQRLSEETDQLARRQSESAQEARLVEKTANEAASAVVQLQEKTDAATAHLGRALKEETSRLDAQFVEALDALHAQSSAKLLNIEQTASTHHDHFSSLCEKLNSDLHNSMTNMNEQFMQKLGESGQAAEANALAVENVRAQLQDKMTQVTEAINQQILTLTSNVQAAEGANASRHGDHENKLETALRELDGRLRNAAAATHQQGAQFEEQIKALNGRMRTELTSQVAEWKRAETELKQTVATVKRSMDGLPQHIDRQIRESSAAQDRKATEQNARVLQLCQQLDGRLTSEVGAAEARVGEAVTRLERQLSDEMERTGTGTQDIISRLASAVDQTASDTTKMGADLDKKFTSVCSKLDEKHNGALANAKGQLEADLRVLESSAQKQADDYEERFRTSAAKFSDDMSVLETRIRDTDRHTADVREKLTASVSTLDRQLDVNAASADESVAAIARHVDDIVRSFNDKIREIDTTHESRAAEERRAAEVAREDLVRQIESVDSQAATKLSELTRTSEDLLRQLHDTEDRLASNHATSLESIRQLSIEVHRNIEDLRQN